MTSRLWSISALSTELRRDRRTVAKALQNVPADGVCPGGHKGWLLTTALRALGSDSGQLLGEPELASEFIALRRLANPVDKAVLLTALRFAYIAGPLATSAA